MKTYQGYNILELAKMALEKPQDFGWWGDEKMFVSWGWAGIDKSNASDVLEISNFEFIMLDLNEKYPNDFEIVGLGHWVVGHTDRLTCRILIDPNKGIVEDNITPAFHGAIDWLIELGDYPIADDEHFYECCIDEITNSISQDFPEQIFIKNNKQETVELILDWLLENEFIYPTDFCLSNEMLHENALLHAAYSLSLCDAEYQNFWDEFVLDMGLATIYWGDNYGAPSNKVHILEGQLNLFEEEH